MSPCVVTLPPPIVPSSLSWGTHPRDRILRRNKTSGMKLSPARAPTEGGKPALAARGRAQKPLQPPRSDRAPWPWDAGHQGSHDRRQVNRRAWQLARRTLFTKTGAGPRDVTADTFACTFCRTQNGAFRELTTVPEPRGEAGKTQKGPSWFIYLRQLRANVSLHLQYVMSLLFPDNGQK